MQRKITLTESEFYHIYNRGVEKREIFSDINDRERFLRLLFIANSTEPFNFRDIKNKKLSGINRGASLVAIGSYCLMPNHFHLLVKEVVSGGTSAFMEKLSTGYSMYFNKKHARVGPLFQGRFKAQHVDNDQYLKYLFAYIHLNPIKLIDSRWKENRVKDRKRAERYLSNYRYSSYSDYSGSEREERAILTTQEFPVYFEDTHGFNDFLNEWLDYKESEEE
ncbi:transposase [Candidatus Kaiserbacteria bacterium]|nr:transposase [Candidatus Kaiserbacteria bacterium]